MSKMDKLIVVGDRILIKPDEDKEKTGSGLYLPSTVAEQEKVQGGWVLKKGPGYPLPDADSLDDEPWSTPKHGRKYIALQAEEGDYALFLRKSAIEIEYENEKYLIVSHAAILLLIRNDFPDVE